MSIDGVAEATNSGILLQTDRPRREAQNMPPERRNQVLAAIQTSSLKRISSSGSQTIELPRKIRRVEKKQVSMWDAFLLLKQCDEEVLHKLDMSEMVPENSALFQPLEKLLKIRVFDFISYSPHVKKVLLERFSSIPMDEEVPGEGEEVRSMPIVKLLHLTPSQINNCIDQVPASLIPLLSPRQMRQVDLSKLLPGQWRQVVGLFFSPEEVKNQIAHFTPAKIDELFSCLSDEEYKFISDEQLSQLMFKSAIRSNFCGLFPGMRQRNPGEFFKSKLRFSILTPEQVNKIFDRLLPEKYELLSDTQFLRLEWDRLTSEQVLNLFPIDSEEVKEESRRRINLLPPDQRYKALGKLSAEQLSLIRFIS